MEGGQTPPRSARTDARPSPWTLLARARSPAHFGPNQIAYLWRSTGARSAAAAAAPLAARAQAQAQAPAPAQARDQTRAQTQTPALAWLSKARGRRRRLLLLLLPPLLTLDPGCSMGADCKPSRLSPKTRPPPPPPPLFSRPTNSPLALPSNSARPFAPTGAAFARQLATLSTHCPVTTRELHFFSRSRPMRRPRTVVVLAPTLSAGPPLRRPPSCSGLTRARLGCSRLKRANGRAPRSSAPAAWLACRWRESRWRLRALARLRSGQRAACASERASRRAARWLEAHTVSDWAPPPCASGALERHF